MGEQLSPLDATFLELEQDDDSSHMHIGAVMVFDPLPGGGAPDVETVRQHLAARLNLPRYRQRLSAPRTGGLSWPTWESDPRFDVAGHVRQAALPAPGGDEELLEWASDFYSHRLDRSHPLWEIVLLHGLADDRWALVSKTHHCLVDGVGSVDAAYQLLDLERDAAKEPRAPPQTSEDDDEPPGEERTGLAPALIAKAAVAGLHAAQSGVHAALHPREAWHKSRAMAEFLVRDELMAAPSSSINVPIGGRRRLEIVRVALDDLKAIRRELGGTVNDVVLAVATGGLRRLLLERGEELPAQGLRAMVPMNIRRAEEHADLGNKVTSLFVDLPVDEADPSRRYQRTVAAMRTLKSGSQAAGGSALVGLTALAPPVLHASLARSLFAPRLFNLTITNVPGPQLPLYAFGAYMREVYPLVPLFADHAVGIAIFSYDGRIFFGLNADREAMPDLDVLRDGIEAALSEMQSLVQTGAP
jgi:WS/DGAT/MGAT family acyltransferase